MLEPCQYEQIFPLLGTISADVIIVGHATDPKAYKMEIPYYSIINWALLSLLYNEPHT